MGASTSETKQPVSRIATWALLGLCATACLVVGQLRDLAGDEVNMLHGDPLEVLQWSLWPDGAFTGHLPLSPILRWMALRTFGEGAPLAWRLHAIGAFLLTVGLVARRGGLWPAILVAVHPILLFHATDSGNYAWSALVGLLLWWGACGLRDGGGAKLWLGACFGVALVDFYLVPLAFLAAVWIVASGISGGPRGILPRAMGGVAVASGSLLLVGLRLFGMNATADATALHADLPPPSELPVVLEVMVRTTLRMVGAVVGGYPEGRQRALWEAGPLLCMGLGMGCWLWRRGGQTGRGVIVWVLGGLVLRIGVGIVVEVGAGRILPFEPRTFVAIIVPLLYELGRSFSSNRVSGIWFLVCCTFAARSGADLWSVGDLRARTMSVLTEQMRPQDGGMWDAELQRVGGLPANAVNGGCGGSADRVFVSFDHAPPSDCGGRMLCGLWLWSPPSQERNAASFQPVRGVAQFGGEPPPLVIQPELGGFGPGSWEVAGLDVVWVLRAPELPGGMSVGPFDRFGREIGRSEPRPGGASVGGLVHVEVDPLDLPIVRAALRLLEIGLGIWLLVLGMVRRAGGAR